MALCDLQKTSSAAIRSSSNSSKATTPQHASLLPLSSNWGRPQHATLSRFQSRTLQVVRQRAPIVAFDPSKLTP